MNAPSVSTVNPWVEWALRALLTGLLGFAVAYLRDSSKELTTLNVSMIRIESENRRIGDKLEEMSRDFSRRIAELNERVTLLESDKRPKR